MKRLLISILVLFGLFTVLAQAGENEGPSYGPSIPKAVGAPHPEGNEFVRINHMNLLQHDRDDAMRLGDRTIDYSLKECVACHAVTGVNAEPVGYEDEQHFCRVCHDYVAVKIDCFTCHKSTPDEDILKRLLAAQNAQMTPVNKAKQDAELAAYIRDVTESTGNLLAQREKITEEVAQ